MWEKCPDLDNRVCEACSYQGAVVRYIDSCDTARNIHKTEVMKYVKNKIGKGLLPVHTDAGYVVRAKVGPLVALSNSPGFFHLVRVFHLGKRHPCSNRSIWVIL